MTNQHSVFICWSDDLQPIAEAVGDLLTKVFDQRSNIRISSRDIPMGDGWLASLMKMLEEANYAVVCLTRSSLAAPWLHFEAGVIARHVGEQKRISPLLFGLSEKDVADTPLGIFQAKRCSQEGIHSLVTSINDTLLEGKKTPAEIADAVEKHFPTFRTESNGRWLKSTHRRLDITQSALDLYRFLYNILTPTENLVIDSPRIPNIGAAGRFPNDKLREVLEQIVEYGVERVAPGMRVYLVVRLRKPQNPNLPYQFAVSLSPTDLIPGPEDEPEEPIGHPGMGHGRWQVGLLVGRESLIHRAFEKNERLRVPSAMKYRGNARLEDERSVLVQPVEVQGKAVAVVGISAQHEDVAADDQSFVLAKELALMISTVLERSVAGDPATEGSDPATRIAELWEDLKQDPERAVGAARIQVT